MNKDYIIDKYNNEYKYFELNGTAVDSVPADPQPSVADLVENGKLNPEEGYTDGINTYVLRNGQYHLVDNEGNVNPDPASVQPDPNVTRRAKNLKTGVVDKNVVVTDANGEATITFLLPNDENGQKYYYVKETKAPEGYFPESDPYAFKIDADLKTITLEQSNHEHTKPWWQKLYELIFGDSGDSKITDENWDPAQGNRGGTLTVKDTPIVADILVRKYWNDNNDQDGKRPGDKNNPTATTDPDLPTVKLQYTLGAHTANGSNIYTDGKGNYYVHNTSDDQYYVVIKESGNIKEDIAGIYSVSAADPRPDSATLSDETCQGKPVYLGSDSKKYVEDVVACLQSK